MGEATPARQTPGIYHRRVGDLTVTALYDGFLDAGLGIVTGVPEPELAAMQEAQFRADPPRLPVCSFLIWGAGDAPVLIDAGAGATFGPAAGRLPESLHALGVDPASVRTVLLTHLHSDHYGGLIDGAGAAAFPNAELVLHPIELEFWTDEANTAAAPEGAKEALARTVKLYGGAGRVRPISQGEGVPGVSIHPLPGHTPGHSGWMVRSRGQSLLIWGDVVHMPAIQFARPEACLAFDTDPGLAAATRKTVLETAASERLAVAGTHLDFPTFGHVAREGAGHRWVPEAWDGGI